MKLPNRSTRVLALLAVFFTAACVRADVLLDENFDNAKAGSAPAKAASFSPRKNTDTLAIATIDGANKGVRLLDNDPKSLGLEYNIAPSETDQKSAIKIAFEITWNGGPADAAANAAMAFGAGKYGEDKNTLTSLANRYFTLSFYANGTARIVSGEKEKSKTQQLGAKGTRNQFVIYLNDSAAAVKTKSPDGKPLSIAADSIVVWQNGKQVFSGKVDKFAGAEKQIGRIGFATTSAATGLDFTVAKLHVETLDK